MEYCEKNHVLVGFDTFNLQCPLCEALAEVESLQSKIEDIKDTKKQEIYDLVSKITDLKDQIQELHE